MKITISFSSKVLIILLIFEFLMEPVPTHISFSLIGFILTYILLWLYSFRQRMSLTYAGYLGGFICVISILMLISLFKGVVPFDIVRGIAPFLLIATFFPISTLLLQNKITIREINFAIYLYGYLYSLNNIFLYLTNEFFNSVKVFRITIMDPNTLSSVPLFLASISFFHFLNSSSNKMSYLHLLTFLVGATAIVVTQTRSLLLCLILFVVVILFFNINLSNKKFLKKLLSILTIFSITVIFAIQFLSNSNIYRSFVERLSNLSTNDRNVTERLDEYNAAINVLSENLLFGGGIGVRFSEHDGVTVNYVHNVVMYTLANVGLTGFLLLGFLLVIYIFYTLKIKDKENLNYFLAISSILVFSLFFSTYKWFSHNILLAIAISIFFTKVRENYYVKK